MDNGIKVDRFMNLKYKRAKTSAGRVHLCGLELFSVKML
jgi:hypothetical protein